MDENKRQWMVAKRASPFLEGQGVKENASVSSERSVKRVNTWKTGRNARAIKVTE